MRYFLFLLRQSSFIRIGLSTTLVGLLLTVNSANANFADPVDVIDSLQRVLRNTDQDTVRISLYHALRKVYSSSQLDSASFYAHGALALSQKIDDSTQIANSYVKLAEVEASSGNLHRAIDHLQKALPLAQQIQDSFLLFTTYHHIGEVRRLQQNYNAALQHTYRALDIAEDLRKYRYVASTLISLGRAYVDLKDYNQAIIIYKKILPYQDSIGSTMLINVLGNLAMAYSSNQNDRQALHYYRRSLQIARAERHRLHELSALNNIASVYNSP